MRTNKWKSLSVWTNFIPVSSPSRCKKNMLLSFSATFCPSRCRKSMTLSKTHVSNRIVLVFPEKSSFSGIYALAMMRRFDGFVNIEMMSGLPHAYVVYTNGRLRSETEPIFDKEYSLKTAKFSINYITAIENRVKIDGIVLPSFQHSAWVFVEASNQCNMAGPRFRRHVRMWNAMNAVVQYYVTQKRCTC